MKFSPPLQQGLFLKRYKRFFADIEWQGKVITAHVANTGSLKSCSETGSLCAFSVSEDPQRKLPYSLQMIQAPSGAWVGINTSIPNKIVGEALQKGLLTHWAGFDEIKAEVKISAESRLDFALSKNKSDKKHYIEVKNVTLAQDQVAYFPDAVTTRGQKHLRDLLRLQSEGHTVEIVFTIQRSDVKKFAAADFIDPDYSKIFSVAKKKGLVITPLMAEVSPEGIELTQKKLPIL